MESSQCATVGGALVLGVIAVVLAVGLAPGVAAQTDNATATSNASFGAQVSAFMQSTAADANGSVDRGMWAGAADNASNPGEVVSERARKLEQRVDRLEARSEELAVAANESGPGGVVYTARASAVRAELANLRQSVNQTVATAADAGVADDRLTTLRERAGNVSGPEVASNARNLTSDDPGPPEWVPGGSNGTAGPPTETPGADPGNRSEGEGPGDGGPPDDRGDGAPPDDAGNGGQSDNGGEAGPSNEGNGNPPDDAGDGGAGGDAGSGGSDNAGSGGNSGNSDNAGSGGQGNRP